VYTVIAGLSRIRHTKKWPQVLHSHTEGTNQTHRRLKYAVQISRADVSCNGSCDKACKDCYCSKSRRLFSLLDSEVTMTLLWMITLSSEWPGCILCGRAVVQRGYHWALSSQGKSYGPSPAIRKLSFASVIIQSQFSTSKFRLGEEFIIKSRGRLIRTLSDRLSLSVHQGYFQLQSSCLNNVIFHGLDAGTVAGST
jgi:hypothetical protein